MRLDSLDVNKCGKAKINISQNKEPACLLRPTYLLAYQLISIHPMFRRFITRWCP